MSPTDNSTTSNNHDGEESHGTVILFLAYSVLAACTYEIIVCVFLKNRLPIPFTVVVLLLGLIVGVIANLALWFATHFLFRAHWAPMASLPLVLPDLATLDVLALALSCLAGGLLRFGLGPTLAISVGAGILLGLL